MDPASRDQRLRPGFRRWFLQPPRAHGEVIIDRRVSPLELFYDLVYVVLVGRTAATLAEHVTWTGVGHFCVVFALIWVAWFNGSLYHELHGREDGRHRSLIFVQMGILGILGRYVDDATGEDGRWFAVTYTVLLAVQTYQWFSVRQRDVGEFRVLATRYLVGMVALDLLMASTIPMSPEARLWVWVMFVACWLIGPTILYLQPRSDTAVDGMRPTESMVERFDLFTIIVLGEVVVGVVDGLAHAPHGGTSTITGILALVIGFGFWWNYFDLIGGRLPRNRGPGFPTWVFGHLVITLAITSAGGAMVGLVEHAGPHAVDPATGWLLASSVALVLATLAPVMLTLERTRALDRVRGPAAALLLSGAVTAVVLGGFALPAWLLALLLSLVLSVTWFLGFSLHLRLDPAPAS